MRARKIILRLCGVVLLLACASVLTFVIVRILTAPASSPVWNGTIFSTGENDDSEWKTRWQYTEADLETALSLKTENYADQSVEAFAKALADWTDEDVFHSREEAMGRLERTYDKEGQDAGFILYTLAASMGEASTRHYGGYCTSLTDSFYDTASWERYEDVFGDSYMVFQAQADYQIRYTILDGAKLTVGERDQILTAYREGVQTFLEGLSEKQLLNEASMKKKLERELKRLDGKLSTDLIKLEGSELNWYSAYGPG